MKTKEQRSLYAREWRKSNPDKISDANKKHRQRLKDNSISRLEFCSRAKCSNKIPETARTNALYCSRECGSLVRVARYKIKHPERVAANVKNWQKNNIDKRKVYDSIRYRDKKQKVLNYYGNVCSCYHCKENNPDFLTIDHINNDGAMHRKLGDKSGKHIYRWLITHNFPTGYQILCWNCNHAKQIYGECPHNLTNVSND